MLVACTAMSTADPTTEPPTDPPTDPTGAEIWRCDTTNDGTLCICDTFSGQGPLESCGGVHPEFVLWVSYPRVTRTTFGKDRLGGRIARVITR